MNLREYARAHGTNIKQVAEQIGVSPSTLYAISSGETDFDHAGISIFIAIAKALRVSTDEMYAALRYGEERQDECSTCVLTKDEREIIEVYRNISPQGQDAVMTLIKGIEQKFGWGDK